MIWQEIVRAEGRGSAEIGAGCSSSDSRSDSRLRTTMPRSDQRRNARSTERTATLQQYDDVRPRAIGRFAAGLRMGRFETAGRNGTEYAMERDAEPLC